MVMSKRKYTKKSGNRGWFRKLTWEQYCEKYLDESGRKQCVDCSEWFKFDTFPNNNCSPFGKMHSCRDCHNKRCREQHAKLRATCPKYKAKARNQYTMKKYGVTSAEYDALLEGQNGKCYICAIDIAGRTAHLDHCHTTGRIRKFLCTNCNRGLGHFQESPSNLANAIKYIEEHK
jgi:hypothetical protein